MDFYNIILSAEIKTLKIKEIIYEKKKKKRKENDDH